MRQLGASSSLSLLLLLVLLMAAAAAEANAAATTNWSVVEVPDLDDAMDDDGSDSDESGGGGGVGSSTASAAAMPTTSSAGVAATRTGGSGQRQLRQLRGLVRRELSRRSAAASVTEDDVDSAAAAATKTAAAANLSVAKVPDLDAAGDESGSSGVWSTASSAAAVSVATKSSLAAGLSASGTGGSSEHRRLLSQLGELVRRELSRRSAAVADDAAARAGKRAAELSDVFSAAAKVGAAVAKAAAAAATTPSAAEAVSGDTTSEAPAPNIFVALWRKILSVMPLAAAIAMFAGAGLILILILVLILYCCCCRKSAKLSRKKVAPPSVLYKDLDLTGANRPMYGKIKYSLEYDLKKDNLIVCVSNCFDLPKGLDSLDPYVVVSVMTEKEERQGRTRGTKTKTTKVVKNSSNPVFNFTCAFPVKKKSELKEKVVVFEVFDWDYGIKHDMVARKVIHLRKMGEILDEILGRDAEFTKALHKGLPRDERGPGDICLALYYAAKDMSLTVNIVECKGVFVAKGKEEPDLETLPNTFVRLSLRHPQLKREQIKHSKTVFGSRNPYFNQQFIFEVGGRDMLETCVLRISLVHKTETLRIKRPVGSLELYSGAEPDTLPLLHWRELLQTPNRATARWHNLITPEQEERNRKAKEKEEKRRLQEQQEDEEATMEAAKGIAKPAV